MRSGSMIKSFAISIISVALCIQLMMLPTRGWLIHLFGQDRPYLKLCEASNVRKCSRSGPYTEISLNRRGMWVSKNQQTMNDGTLIQFFQKLTEENNTRDQTTVLRIRIAGKAPAKRFIHLTHCAGEAWIENILVAVWNR